MMQRTPLCISLIAALTATATAQVQVETFENGNPDQWTVWFSSYSSLVPSGGNPGAYVELDNFTQGPATCHFVEIYPDDNPGVVPYFYSGDWRARDVQRVSLDLRVEQGYFGGDIRLELISDPNTPGDTSDDCVVFLELVGVGPPGNAWTTFSFPIPAADLTIPSGWQVEAGGPCSGIDPNFVWNDVIQDVDQIRFVYDGGQAAFCLFTDWILGVDNITVEEGGLSTNYCNANPNSTGSAASMGGSGSLSVAANDLTLRCELMPPGVFGIFLVSDTQAFVPNVTGSQGNLCLGGVIGRYNAPGQILNSGPNGQMSLAIDLGAIPQGSQISATAAGDTWNFSAWFRDFAGTQLTSNFADGLELTFQP